MNATGERTAGSSAGTQATTGEFPRAGCEPAIAFGTHKLGSPSDPPLAAGSGRIPSRATRLGCAGGTRALRIDGPRPTGALCSEMPAASLPPAPLTAAPGRAAAPWMRTHLTGIWKLFLHCPCLVLDIRAVLYPHLLAAGAGGAGPFPSQGIRGAVPGRSFPLTRGERGGRCEALPTLGPSRPWAAGTGMHLAGVYKKPPWGEAAVLPEPPAEAGAPHHDQPQLLPLGLRRRQRWEPGPLLPGNGAPLPEERGRDAAPGAGGGRRGQWQGVFELNKVSFP